MVIEVQKSALPRLFHFSRVCAALQSHASLPAQRNIIEEDRPRHNYCTAEDASRKKPLLLPNVDVNCDDLEDHRFGHAGRSVGYRNTASQQNSTMFAPASPPPSPLAAWRVARHHEAIHTYLIQLYYELLFTCCP